MPARETTVKIVTRETVAKQKVRIDTVEREITSATVRKRAASTTSARARETTVQRVLNATTISYTPRRTIIGTSKVIYLYLIRGTAVGRATMSAAETVIRGAKATAAGAATAVGRELVVRGAAASAPASGTLTGEIRKVWSIAASAAGAALMTLAEFLLIKEATGTLSGAATMTGDAEVLQIVHITANTTDVVMTDLFTAGQLSSGGDCVVQVDAGVYVYGSDTSTPGMRTGTASVAGTLILVNNGYIYGCGGAGGTSEASCTANEAGYPGGTALLMEQDLTIDNNGSILGGGGGGGSGLSYYQDYCSKAGCTCVYSRKGTGGGGGQPYGAGGAAGTPCCSGLAAAGSAGTLVAAGSRGTYACSGAKGWGGDGGAAGAAGNGGVNQSCGGVASTGTAGGAAGTAVDENGYTRTDI